MTPVPFDLKKVRFVCFEVEKIIANPPATIVFWKDGSKTIVKQQPGDGEYDLEKGFAMAFIKHLKGDKGRYNNYIKKALDKVILPKEKKTKKVAMPNDASELDLDW